LDDIEEVKEVRDTLMATKEAGKIKGAVDDLLARVNDKSLKQAIKTDIERMNVENKKAGKKGMGDLVTRADMDEVVNAKVAQMREEGLKKIESDYNITLDRETGEFTPNKGGIKEPKPMPTKTTYLPADYRGGTKKKETVTPVEQKPVVPKEETAFDDPFFGGEKRKEEPTVAKITEKIKRVTNTPKVPSWMDAVNALFQEEPTAPIKPPNISKPKTPSWMKEVNNLFPEDV
jgi:hypothetical protein